MKCLMLVNSFSSLNSLMRYGLLFTLCLQGEKRRGREAQRGECSKVGTGIQAVVPTFHICFLNYSTC